MDEKRKAAGAPAAPAGEYKPMKFCVLSHTRMGVNIEEFDTPQKRLSWLSLQSDVVDDFYILDIEGTIRDYGAAPVGSAAAEDLAELSR